MKKRLLGSLFSGLMLCFAAQSAVWATAETITDPATNTETALQWELDSNGETLTISKKTNGGTGSTAIPDYSGNNNQPWRGDAGANISTIESVIIEDGVTEIGKNAFFQHTALASATIADSVTSIGRNAFNGCTGLTSVTLPCVESIGDAAFNGCTTLASATLPCVESIGDDAFKGCTGLTSVTLPCVESIGVDAFNGCTTLTSATLPCKAQIGPGAFYGADGSFALTYTHEPLADVTETPATCTSPKIAAHKKCSGCSQLFAIESTLTKLGKILGNYETYTVTSPAAEGGTTTTTYYEVKESDLYDGKPLDYNMNLVSAQEATCTSKGVTAHYVCTECGKKFARTTTEATEDTPSSKHCCLYGGVIYECEEAKDADVETDCVPHTYSDLIKKVPATCVDEGSEEHYECTVCGKKFVLATNDKGEPIYQEASDASLIIPATGHSYSEWATTEATTTSEGEKTRYCSNCGDVETSKLSKLATEETSGSVSLTPTTYGYAVDTGDFISGEMFAYAYGLCACGVVFVSLRKKKSKV